MEEFLSTLFKEWLRMGDDVVMAGLGRGVAGTLAGTLAAAVTAGLGWCLWKARARAARARQERFRAAVRACMASHAQEKTSDDDREPGDGWKCGDPARDPRSFRAGQGNGGINE